MHVIVVIVDVVVGFVDVVGVAVDALGCCYCRVGCCCCRCCCDFFLGVMLISPRQNNFEHRCWSIAQGRRVAWLPMLSYQHFVSSNFVTRQAIKRRCASGPAR